MSKYIRFRRRKFQEKVIVSEIKRLSLKSLSVKELKKTKKLSFLNFLYRNDPQILTNIFPFSNSTINIKDFMNYI